MADWMDFEIHCTDYLNDRFRAYAHFIHQGGADSTVPDILVETKHGNSFYMDAKHSPAHGILFNSYHISNDRLDPELSNLFLCISL